MNVRMFTLLSFIFIAGTVLSEVWVYPGPSTSLQSAEYEVTVFQNGKSFQSFVYADKNQFSKQLSKMTDYNHFTTFSFSEKIKVQVKKLNGNINTAEIRPLSDSIKVNLSGNTLSFWLNTPKKLFVKMDGMYDHPLFIFADAPETNIPNPNDSNVIYWKPGVHDIGKHYPCQSNKSYYIAGGAYLKGSFLGTDQSNVKIYGRGILSGENIEHCGYKQCRFDGVAINLAGNTAKNLYIEGITIIKPAQYCIQGYGGQMECHNIKCFGWWYETDGWVAGNGSHLYDSFFKVNDDVVKMYFSNVRVNNLVIYHQMNGAPFQMGWGQENASNSIAEDIDIIAEEVTHSPQYSSNRTLVNTATGNSRNKMTNITYKNIRVDDNIAQIIGIRTEGNYKNIVLDNIKINGIQLYDSYLSGGIFENIFFNNISIQSNCVDSSTHIGLGTIGTVTNLKFNKCD